MKDSQLSRYDIHINFKYIKANNERFSTLLQLAVEVF